MKNVMIVVVVAMVVAIVVAMRAHSYVKTDDAEQIIRTSLAHLTNEQMSRLLDLYKNLVPYIHQQYAEAKSDTIVIENVSQYVKAKLDKETYLTTADKQKIIDMIIKHMQLN
jgi:hypothetical protein